MKNIIKIVFIFLFVISGTNVSAVGTPVVITQISATNLNQSFATISWTTNIPSDSRVNFWITPTQIHYVYDPTITTSHTVVLGGLSPATTYFYKVKSVDLTTNMTKTSGEKTFTTPGFSLPSVPLTPSATPNNATVDLNWTAPIFNGNSMIIDYVIKYKQTNNLTWLTYADGLSPLTQATISGLNNDTSYDFKIAAANSVGVGSYTTPISMTPFDPMNTEIKVSKTLGQESINSDGIIEGDETNNTDDVRILAFDITAEQGNVKNIQDIPIKLTSTGAGVIEIVDSILLVKDNNVEDSSSVSAGTNALTNGSPCTSSTTVCYFHFNGIDFDLNNNQTLHFEIHIDIKDLDGTFSEGDTIIASVETDGIYAENQIGIEISNLNKIGTASGGEKYFYSHGIYVNLISNSSNIIDIESGHDIGEFSINFSVTAFGEDIYLEKNLVSSTSTSSTPIGNNRVAVVSSSGTILPASFVMTSSTTQETNTYRINEGETETFTISAAGTGQNSLIRAVLYGLEYGDSDTPTGDSVYKLNMGQNGDFVTPYLFVD